MSNLSFCRWTMETLFLFNISTFTAALHDSKKSLLDVYSYNENDLTKCIAALISMGIFWHAMTLLAVIFANAQKRK